MRNKLNKLERKKKQNLLKFYYLSYLLGLISLLILIYYPLLTTALAPSPEDYLPIDTEEFFYFSDKDSITFPFLRDEIARAPEFIKKYPDFGLVKIDGHKIFFVRKIELKPLGFERTISDHWFEKKSKSKKIFAFETNFFWFFSDNEVALANISLVQEGSKIPLKKDKYFLKLRNNIFRTNDIYYYRLPRENIWSNLITSLGFSLRKNEISLFIPTKTSDPNKKLSQFIDFQETEERHLLSVQTRNLTQVLMQILEATISSDSSLYFRFLSKFRKLESKYWPLKLFEKDLSFLSEREGIYLDSSFSCLDLLNKIKNQEIDYSKKIISIHKPKSNKEGVWWQFKLNDQNIYAYQEDESCHLSNKKEKFPQSKKDNSSAFLKLFISKKYQENNFSYPPLADFSFYADFIPRESFWADFFWTGKGLFVSFRFLES